MGTWSFFSQIEMPFGTTYQKSIVKVKCSLCPELVYMSKLCNLCFQKSCEDKLCSLKQRLYQLQNDEYKDTSSFLSLVQEVIDLGDPALVSGTRKRKKTERFCDNASYLHPAQKRHVECLLEL